MYRVDILGLYLTHWGRVTHICVSKLTIMGSDNGLSPGRRQAIIWTNAGTLLIGSLETKFNEILIKMHTSSFNKMHLKLSSGKCWPFCLGLNVLRAREYIALWFSLLKSLSDSLWELWLRRPIAFTWLKPLLAVTHIYVYIYEYTYICMHVSIYTNIHIYDTYLRYKTDICILCRQKNPEASDTRMTRFISQNINELGGKPTSWCHCSNIVVPEVKISTDIK